MIGSDDGFSPSWFRWTDGLGSFLLSVDGRKMNEMLCHPMMPRKAIESIDGTSNIMVDLDGKKVLFDVDETDKIEKVKAAITSAGYQV